MKSNSIRVAKYLGQAAKHFASSIRCCWILIMPISYQNLFAFLKSIKSQTESLDDGQYLPATTLKSPAIQMSFA